MVMYSIRSGRLFTVRSQSELNEVSPDDYDRPSTVCTYRPTKCARIHGSFNLLSVKETAKRVSC